MLSPKDIIRGKVSELERICDLFAQRGMAREYRLAQMLRSTSARLFNLRPTLLPEITHSADTSSEDNAPYLDVANGYWGCRDNCRWLIEPLFDNGYEPTYGVMLTELGGYSHFVDLEGNVVKSFPMGTRVKPMRDGATTAYYPNGEQEYIKAEDLLQILDK